MNLEKVHFFSNFDFALCGDLDSETLLIVLVSLVPTSINSNPLHPSSVQLI